MDISSSDDSFLWTSGSSDSDSTIMNPITINFKQEKVEDKCEFDNGNSKKTKKKKHDISLNSEDKCESDDGKRKKTKKIKYDASLNSEDKCDSDNRNSNKKKKRKHDTSLNSSDNLERNHIESITEMEVTHTPTHVNRMAKKDESEHSENKILENPQDEKTKKKKKDKDKHKRVDVDSADSVLLEETYLSNTTLADESHNIVEKRKKKKKRRTSRTDSENECIQSDDSAKEKLLKQSLINGLNEVKGNKRNVQLSNEDETDNNCSVINNDYNKSHNNVSINGNDSDSEQEKVIEHKNPIKRVTKNSDRLVFEDDTNDLKETFDNTNDLALSNEIKIYLDNNKHLIPKIVNSIVESEDEDEWILFCPPQININDFKDIDLVMEDKKKVKIGGQNYDRTVEIVNNLAQVRYKNNHSVLSHITAIQIHSICKRIPKPHVPEDEIMLNNQTNFIPLPETKCRHPLFGPNYKKAIKVPKIVDERLHLTDSKELVPKLKKKKHKKERTKVEADSELETSLNSSEVVIKKKKKRKHSKDECTERGSKKIKLESNSGGFWENEKTIEQNLFNF